MTVGTVTPREAASIVADVIRLVQRGQAWWSEIDGATGDGEHGLNMGEEFRPAGLDAARTMVAGPGRPARLGEPSRGTPSVGAASCDLLLGVRAGGLLRSMAA